MGRRRGKELTSRFVILFSHPHHDAHWIIIEAEADGVRPCSHFDSVAHMILKPVLHFRLHPLLALSVFLLPSPAQLREWTRSEVEVD